MNTNGEFVEKNRSDVTISLQVFILFRQANYVKQAVSVSSVSLFSMPQIHSLAGISPHNWFSSAVWFYKKCISSKPLSCVRLRHYFKASAWIFVCNKEVTHRIRILSSELSVFLRYIWHTRRFGIWFYFGFRIISLRYIGNLFLFY